MLPGPRRIVGHDAEPPGASRLRAVPSARIGPALGCPRPCQPPAQPLRRASAADPPERLGRGPPPAHLPSTYSGVGFLGCSRNAVRKAVITLVSLKTVSSRERSPRLIHPRALGIGRCHGTERETDKDCWLTGRRRSRLPDGGSCSCQQ